MAVKLLRDICKCTITSFLYLTTLITLVIIRKKLYVIQEFSLFSFIGEKLKVFELTLTSYNALYEVKS